MIQITVQNTNGITEKVKQIPKKDIIILTETHKLNDKKTRIFNSFQDYKYIHSDGSNHSKGVTILYHNSLKINNTKISQTGNYIIISIIKDNEKYQVVGIYLEPDNSKINALKPIIEDLSNKLDDNSNIILAGDLNCLPEEIDSLKKTRQTKLHKQKYRNIIKPLMQKHNLIDVWREVNPKMIDFTHTSNQNSTRLDHTLVSKQIATKIEVKYKQIGPFDHKAINININKREKWGKGTWKLNTSILTSREIINQTKNLIKQIQQDKILSVDPLKWWDNLKKKLKLHFVKISINISKQKNKEKQTITDTLNSEMNKQTKSQEIIKNETKKLNDILDKEYRGALIRSKIQEVHQNDRPGKYFFALEKIRGSDKIIQKLKTNNNTTTTDKAEIINEITTFYKNLYTTEPTNDINQRKICNLISHKKLKGENKELGKFITEPEIKKALNKMANNKSPGNDGLPKEFYITFWEELKSDLVELYNNIYLKKCLPESQKNATIRLIYKKDDPEQLKNWRPISLPNTDYKILSKVLSNRLGTVMPEIIGKDQYCGVKDRGIEQANETLMKIWEIETKFKRNGLCYLMIDQEKAFDRMNHDYLFKILKAYNFPNTFITWIKIIYKDINSKIEINGTYTDTINVTRSIRQGCPISMLLFIIGAEGMAELIRSERLIKGYTIAGGIEKKMVAYADDTTLILTSIESIRIAMNTIKIYCSASGAKINDSKLECIQIGKWEGIQIQELLSWIKTEVKILGLIYTHTNMEQKNYEPQIEKMGKKLERWSKRSHTILGKAHLANIYIIPTIIYRIKHIAIPKDYLKKYKLLLYRFIWGKKIENISREKITKPRHMGGIGLIDIELRQKAIWIQNAINIVEHPNLDHNILNRITIGPTPKLTQIAKASKIKLIPVTTVEIKNQRQLELRLNIGKYQKDCTTRLREIYENLIGVNIDKEEDINYFRHLNKIKVPKLWEYGYLTYYKAHITRSWLHRKAFNIDETNTGPNCPVCHICFALGLLKILFTITRNSAIECINQSFIKLVGLLGLM